MSFYSEFKEFAIKGNMVDMAVGIIIGAAFNEMLNVLVDKVIMPPLNLVTGGINFANQEWILRKEKLDATGTVVVDKVAIQYGEFINVLIDFLIIAFVVFVVVKMMNQLRNNAEDTDNKTVATPKDIELLDNLNKLMEEQNQLLRNKV